MFTYSHSLPDSRWSSILRGVGLVLLVLAAGAVDTLGVSMGQILAFLVPGIAALVASFYRP